MKTCFYYRELFRDNIKAVACLSSLYAGFYRLKGFSDCGITDQLKRIASLRNYSIQQFKYSTKS